MSSEDITFCGYSKCPNKKCERHQSNIKNFNILHSFAYFHDCPEYPPMEFSQEDDWGVDDPEETEEMQTTDNTLYSVNDHSGGIVDPTYINDIIDCSDLGIYPWGNS